MANGPSIKPNAGESAAGSATRGDTGEQHSEQLAKHRERLIPILAKRLPAIIQALLVMDILSQLEVDQVKKKPRAEQRAGLLFDIVIQKPAPKIISFINLLRKDRHLRHALLEFTDTDRMPSNEEVATILTDCLNDRYRGGFHFLQLLRSLIDKGVNISALSFQGGFSLMHKVIQLDMPELLKFIAYAGIWTRLCSLPINCPIGGYARLTPMELATELKRVTCKDALTEINESENSLTEVELCVRSGNLVRFFELKAAYVSQLGSRSLEEKSLLELACQSGHLHMLRAVIAMEQTLPHRRRSINEALAVCIDVGRSDLLQPLLNYIPTDLTRVIVHNRFLIEQAAISGDIASFKALEQLGVPTRETIVTLAAAQNRLPLLRELFTSGRRNDTGISVHFQDKRGKAPAHFAAEKGYIEALRLLLGAGHDLKLTDKHGYTVMHSAAAGGSLPTMEVVIEAASQQGCLDELLLGRDQYLGAERCFLVRGRDQDHAAWHYVEADRGLINIFRQRTAGGTVDVVKYGRVIKSGWGVQPNAQVVQEVESMYDVLKVTANAPLDMQPLHVALIKQHKDVALRLISAMDDVMQQDCFGLTPLHLAAMCGYTDVIKALMDKGAHLSIKDAKGRTPADIAIANDHPVAASTITSHHTSITDTEDLRQRLLQVHSQLSSNNLKQWSISGHTQKLHLKSILRNFIADINDYMFDHLDAGPIAVETHDNK